MQSESSTSLSLMAENVSLKKNQQTILSNIHLQISSGEFVGLIGPNGAGKSSLLKILAGLDSDFTGEVSLLSENKLSLKKMHRLQRAQQIAWLAQQDVPTWPLSVQHLVSLGRLPWSKNISQSSPADLQAIDAAIEQTDLQLLRQRSVLELSGGELQRVLLARVFAGEQPIILVDEPISALDPYHQLHVMELLTEKSKQRGMVCAALHDLNLAAGFCNRLVLLNHGQIVASGQPAEVLTPENLRQVYGIEAYVDCREEGVVIIPRKRVK
ncbi:MAG: ABC transporter ATP-binding protein [Cellvibrio sp.]|nr:ABC transporter ATP-binding protein [Cellvibrio sp.]